jgi:hypothetical protein
MKKLIVISLLTAMFLSCNKDEDQNCTLSTSSAAGTWRITAVRYKANASAAEQDFYNQYFTDPCERDDNVVLNANGTYVFNDAGVQCVPPGDDTGTWSATSTTITVDGGTSNVDNYNCSTITISNVDVFVTGDKIILVLTRQ